MGLRIVFVNRQSYLVNMDCSIPDKLKRIVQRLLGRPFRIELKENCSALNGKCSRDGDGVLIEIECPPNLSYPLEIDRGWGHIRLQSQQQAQAFIAFHEAAHALGHDVDEASADILAISVYNDLLSIGTTDKIDFRR